MSDAHQNHWQSVYASKPEAQTSWYCLHLDHSLHLLDGLALPPDAPLINIGGGRATLVDDLLARGHVDVTVLDLAAAALDACFAPRLECLGDSREEHRTAAGALQPFTYALLRKRGDIQTITGPASC